MLHATILALLLVDSRVRRRRRRRTITPDIIVVAVVPPPTGIANWAGDTIMECEYDPPWRAEGDSSMHSSSPTPRAEDASNAVRPMAFAVIFSLF
jgi:hypothetical protein